MLFHKNNHSKFVTASKKLETKTFESVTEFFEAQFTTNKNNGTLERMELERIKKHAHFKLKMRFTIRYVRVRRSVVLTGQSARLLHAMPNAALTIIARSNIGTSTTIATVIAPATTNVEWQSTIVLSAPAIATGRMTVATISLKS
jgi:hypothetical protein